MRSPKSISGKGAALPSLIQTARQVKREGKAFVVKSNGAALAAVVPLAQYRLTQAVVRRLEDEEDAAFTRAALADRMTGAWSSLDDIRKELGMERRGPQVRKKSPAQAAKKLRRKAAPRG